jgi:heptaprenylglyceryl phosphate synthase
MVWPVLFFGSLATLLVGGSGGSPPVTPPSVRAAGAATDGPLLVGGGIRDAAAARAARLAGADYVVVGTLFERDTAAELHPLVAAARA